MLEGKPAVTPPQPKAAGGDWWQGDDRSPSVAARLYPERLMERRSRLMRIALAGLVTEAARSVARLSLRFGNEPAHGTGFLISEKALLTNHHNVVHEKYGNVTSVVAEFDWEEGFHGEPLVRKGGIDTIVGAGGSRLGRYYVRQKRLADQH